MATSFPQFCPDVHYVDVTPYADKPVSTAKALFKYWFDKAAWHKPSVLILDNIEHLLKAEEEVFYLQEAGIITDTFQ